MAVDTTDYLALNQRIWGKMVAKHAAERALPRFEAAMEAAADAAAMARAPVLAEPCAYVETRNNSRYVSHGYIVLTHMDLSMFNGRLFLADDLRHDCICIYYDRETRGALLFYNAQSNMPWDVTHGCHRLPAEATFRDLVRTFGGADCEIGYTSVGWGGRVTRRTILETTMASLGEVEDHREFNCHITKTTPLRPTTGQIVGGKVVN